MWRINDRRDEDPLARTVNRNCKPFTDGESVGDFSSTLHWGSRVLGSGFSGIAIHTSDCQNGHNMNVRCAIPAEFPSQDSPSFST